MITKLQNGSDIRGIAITTQEHTANLQEAEVIQIARGFLNFLLEKPDLYAKWTINKLKVGIGRDSRISGEQLANAFIGELSRLGVNVIDFGMATTPAMFMATQYEEFLVDASVMFTASHLPFYFNGLKFFTQAGGLEKGDIKYILSHLEGRKSDYHGRVEQTTIIPTYAKDVVSKIRKGSQTNSDTPLAGMHIIVDAGNGAGGFFAKQVLEELGANTVGSQFLEPDGTFPNHIPNPENKEAMESIRKAVLDNQADLGVIFDTDVDRGAVVTKNGEMLNRNNLIAILSYIALAEYPKTAIVTNSLTSYHVSDYIKELGGKHIRYISGYRNIINKAIETNKDGIDCQLAVETSGHAAFKENYFLDDGMYVAAKILMLLPQLKEQNTSLDDLIRQLKQPEETFEARLKINVENFKEYGLNVLAQLEKVNVPGLVLDTDNQEGVRFKLEQDFGQGWYLLRMSLHEPLLVLNVEEDIKGYMPVVLKQLVAFLSQYEAIDISSLSK